MLLAFLFLAGTYYLSRTTAPEEFKTWEEMIKRNQTNCK
jgi:hypothetical protein